TENEAPWAANDTRIGRTREAICLMRSHILEAGPRRGQARNPDRLRWVRRTRDNSRRLRRVFGVDLHVVVAEGGGEDLGGAAAEPEIALDAQLGASECAPRARARGAAGGGAAREHDHAAEPHARAREAQRDAARADRLEDPTPVRVAAE